MRQKSDIYLVTGGEGVRQTSSTGAASKPFISVSPLLSPFWQKSAPPLVFPARTKPTQTHCAD
jgi:hypothetical protein